MPSFYDVQRARTPRPQLRCANHFAFPQTQRKGLLEPTTRTRSSNQRVNLLRSYNDLLDALDVPQLQQSTA